MRLRSANRSNGFKIIAADDEIGIIQSLGVVLERNGYEFTGVTNPVEAIEKIRNESYDLLILDFFMDSMHGDEVVAKIREFNSDLYILLLTGYKDLAPPLETLRALDIQGYSEKSDRFDQLILLVESGIKSITLLRKNRKFEEGLNKILQAVPKIYQLQPIESILEEILRNILPFVNSNNAFILVDNFVNISDDSEKSIFKGIGKYDVDINEFFQILNPDMMVAVGRTRTEKKIEKVENGIIFPLISELGEILGVIFIESSNLVEGLRLIEIYSAQAALSISNAFLHSQVHIKSLELSKTFEELRIRYMDTIEALRLTVDAKDKYTRGHSDRVAFFAVKIEEAFGLSNDKIDLLKTGGIFHDIGKIGTADDIILKTNKLTAEEFNEIMKHPQKGAHILSAVSMFNGVIPLIKCHHERLDGKGYPEGLKGEQIPYLARIISVADAFDAMTSDRVYRAKLDLAAAKEQLQLGCGTQFDENIVNIFIELLVNFEAWQQELAWTYEKD